ncbi:unnamed protein product [Vitrella brassicaformis CCMP3155]|uniref:PhoD-like phosphatase metallophosphatase domain-containing protein n=2 Tax=Vitrella brassicaformis TaxID=1169539 RepID=A0A0G4EAK0_VITBC|nr:unnamed protein product [Vitrella brassicaformis CCMP3155]|mmetsp:Transcript_10636/g.30736  ORF Transcript_10636/g.30736 Transcript_10636/m.30736 type:complete len:753 (+) Transcript_10636:192-2450(+)|eukprot:CEL92288.1 unnamed protein product [Vitrella brassicaformis CCMP3155]
MKISESAALALLACASLCCVSADITASFNHGVASGDPLPDAVIIWTRVTIRSTEAPPRDESVTVSWEVSRFEDFSEVAKNGTFTTDGSRDWTVKVDVTGLESGKRFFFRFIVGGVVSPVGRFKLPMPAGEFMERIKYAAFGCTDLGPSYFSAYDFASRYELDFWLHLGDFIYEYSRIALAPEIVPHQEFDWIPNAHVKPSRDNKTDHFDTYKISGEVFTLQDYRDRYASYRRDPGLQAISASAPMIGVWDDHEFADNSYMNGSRNHNVTLEGDNFETRKRVALKAWYEYQPTREVDEEGNERGFHIYRAFPFGDLARLVMLENRMTARTNSNPPRDPEDPDFPFKVFSDEFESILENVLDILGDTPYDEWEGSEVEQQLIEYKQLIDVFRRRPEGHMIGDHQIDFVKEQIEEMLATNTTWLLVGQQQVVQDLWWFDHEAAIANKKAEGDMVTAAMWQEAFDNFMGIAESPQVCNHQTFPHAKRIQYKQCTDLDDATLDQARAGQAAARYKINWSFDGWQGYTDERDRLLSALAGANGNAAVYASDMHESFVGMLREPTTSAAASSGSNATAANNTSASGAGGRRLDHTQHLRVLQVAGVSGETEATDGVKGDVVAAEFTVGTFSGGAESTMNFAPMDFNDAARVASNVDMRWASTNEKGTFIVTLTHDKHHVDYVFFSSTGTLAYTPMCASSWDFYPGTRVEKLGVPLTDNVIVRAPSCLPFPMNKGPYQYMMDNWGVHVLPHSKLIDDVTG